ncbi:glycosyltransferase [Marinobacter sp.]|uniref:glycosyltransferase n=1 Tax=Marinobacter sp. TaxID=50741 RepID=UPI00384D0818
MSQVRVLQFVTPAGFYGAERWILALANNINSENVICDLAVSEEGNGQDLTVAEVYPSSAGEVHFLPMSGRFDLRIVKRLVHVIKSRKIDIIHTHGYKSDILGLLAARQAGIRCVSTPHGFSGKVGIKLAAFIRLGIFSLRYFDAVAPLSEDLLEDMRRFKVPEAKTQLVRNGVDLKEIDQVNASFSSTIPENEADERLIGFIGQMIPRKGIPDLIQMFDKLYSRDQTLRLELIGDGRQREELEIIAAEKDSASAIKFLGFRSDRLERLSRFNVFIMTSSLEGIPRCMMEAMALGIPVVAYDIPGVDQLIEHGETGLLAPLGDLNALVECCQKILDNPDMAKELASTARAKIDRDYSARRMAEEYESLFLKLIGRASSSSPTIQLAEK